MIYLSIGGVAEW